MEKREVEAKLIQEGIKPNLDGFRYIVDAVVGHDSSERIGSVYSEIARKNNVKWQNVERRIRTAKEKSEKYKSYTCGQLIAMLRWELQQPAS